MSRGLLTGIAVLGLCACASAQTDISPNKAPPPSEKANPRAVPSKKKPIDPAERRRQIVFNLLDEAHAAASELPTEQRIPILKEICGIAFFSAELRTPDGKMGTRGSTSTVGFPDIDDPQAKKKMKDWAEELYRAADELPSGSYAKLEAQAAAVRAMLPSDDKRALEMLDGLEASDDKAAQGQRNYLAVYVFSELQRRRGDAVVPELRARAVAMGDNGQYPYGAMTAVASRIENVETVREIFNDALTSFQHTDDRLGGMFEMLAFLRTSSIRQKLEPWQLHEAAMQIANRLRAEVERERRAYDEGGKMRPGLSMIEQGVRDGLKEVDPDLVLTIPALPPYRPSPAQQTVGDDAPSAVAMSPELKKLKAEFERTSTRLMEMSENEIHEGPELRQVIAKGMDQATELLRLSTLDAKNHSSALESAMPPVTDFVQVASRTNPAFALADVRKVQDSEIRARMLLTVAVGLPH